MTLHQRNQSLQVEKRRALQQLRSKDQLLEKYIFMAQLRTRNIALFYKLVIEHLQVCVCLSSMIRSSFT